MSIIKSIIDTKVNACNTLYKLTVSYVTNSVTYMKTSKSDGNEVQNHTILLIESIHLCDCISFIYGVLSPFDLQFTRMVY